MIKKQKGITLIALVVTIVVLIILATISINAVFGQNGIITRATAAKNLQQQEVERQKLELIKTEVAMDNEGNVTVENYVAELIKQGVTETAEVTNNSDGSKTVITDTGYSIVISPNGTGDVAIIIEGQKGNLPPRIVNTSIAIDGSNVAVTVDARRTEGATLKYYYKTSSGSYQTEPFVASSTSGFTITGLSENETYTIKIELSNEYGTVTKEIEVVEEDTLASAPKVASGMIPVKYETSIGKWVRTTENDESWYNYSSSAKKWANVVLSEATWTSATVNGQAVQALDESKPYSQLVWIPRFAYQIKSRYHFNGDATTAGDIDVAFIDSSNKDKNGKAYSTTYPTVTGSGTATGKMDNFVVHPAFNFGGTQLTGFWIGKFETSFQRSSGEATDTAASGQYEGKDKTVMIKANVSSWRNNTISNMFEVCLDLNKASNIYGLSSSDSVVDPHLLKNDEWGAVAYLSKSKYGKQTEEVYINNNSNYITGIAGDTASASSSTATTNTYNTTAGQKASTTGNIYGVYDMSGGAYEYVAAYVANNNSNLTQYGASLVNSSTPERYRNVYTSNGDTREGNYSVSTPANGHYGDAVYETSSKSSSPYTDSWYADYSYFPCSTGPFFHRGNGYSYTSGAGVFAFSNDVGDSYANIGFRVAVPVL